MSRRCRSNEFRELVEAARAAVPDFNVDDIIVGFPGETDDEQSQTLAFTGQPSHVHIFAYSQRTGTKAAGGRGDRPRSAPAASSCMRVRSRSARGTVRTHRSDLRGIDRQPLENGNWSGYTPNFLRVELIDDRQRDLENRIVTVHTVGLSDDGERLLARPG